MRGYLRDESQMPSELQLDGGKGFANMGFILGCSNWVLSGNAHMNPWVHLETTSQNFQAIPNGTAIIAEMQVKDFFTDVEGGEGPTPASDDALFERDTPIRMVHADVIAMMIGGIRGLLLHMLHPHALQGVLDYSDFRNDAHGRLRRTARP